MLPRRAPNIDLERLTQKDLKSNPKLMYEMAMGKLTGEGVEEDVKEAIQLLYMAGSGSDESMGDSAAIFNLGVLHDQGFHEAKIPPLDPVKANEYYRQAFDANKKVEDPSVLLALYLLEIKEYRIPLEKGPQDPTVLFERGLNAYKENDFYNAVRYFDQAKELGHGDANYYLIYTLVQSASPYNRKALDYLKQAAESSYHQKNSLIAQFLKFLEDNNPHFAELSDESLRLAVEEFQKRLNDKNMKHDDSKPAAQKDRIVRFLKENQERKISEEEKEIVQLNAGNFIETFDKAVKQNTVTLEIFERCYQLARLHNNEAAFKVGLYLLDNYDDLVCLEKGRHFIYVSTLVEEGLVDHKRTTETKSEIKDVNGELVRPNKLHEPLEFLQQIKKLKLGPLTRDEKKDSKRLMDLKQEVKIFGASKRIKEGFKKIKLSREDLKAAVEVKNQIITPLTLIAFAKQYKQVRGTEGVGFFYEKNDKELLIDILLDLLSVEPSEVAYGLQRLNTLSLERKAHLAGAARDGLVGMIFQKFQAVVPKALQNEALDRYVSDYDKSLRFSRPRR